VWLVDSLRECRARFRVLRISIRRSEQKRGGAKGYPEKSSKTLLRKKHSLGHSPAMRAAWGESDYRRSATNYRARDGEIIISGRPSSPKVARWPARQRCLPLLNFCFPTHEASQLAPHSFDRMVFSFSRQLRVTVLAGFHFPNKFAREFSRADLP
jgi:hypothetical protein